MINRRMFGQGFALATATGASGFAKAASSVKIGQSTATLGYLPIWAARTFDTFPAQQLELSWAVINGGDPASLAALDSGDIDLAATGSDAVVDAVTKGQPFQIVYSLMSKMSLELTVSEAFLKRTAVSRDAPILQRINSLKGATIGVTVVGGAQDRTVRWLAGRGGLDPKKDVQVVQIGSAAALAAALENGRIDGFMLSAPEGQIAEAGGFGRILVAPDTDLPNMKGFPSLVLVARTDANEAAQQKIIATIRALDTGAKQLLSDPDAGADRIGAKFFPKLAPAIMRASIRNLADGLRDRGRMSMEGAKRLAAFVEDSGRAAPRGDQHWTNLYTDRALGPT